MVRTLLVACSLVLLPWAAGAECSPDDLIGTWMLRGEGQASPPSGSPSLCAASARARFTADGQVRFSKIVTGCAEGNPTTVSASGTWTLDDRFCLGEVNVTDSLGYTIPFFSVLVLDQGRELRALEQHRLQKAVYRWVGQRQ